MINEEGDKCNIRCSRRTHQIIACISLRSYSDHLIAVNNERLNIACVMDQLLIRDVFAYCG